MKTYSLALSVWLCLLSTQHLRADEPGDDLGQVPSCGAFALETELWQGPNYARSVHGFSQIRRNHDGCLSKMRVEAWVDGIAMSPQIVEGYGVAVSVSYGVPVPQYRAWNAVAKNFLVNFGERLWIGWSHGGTTMELPPGPPKDPDPEFDCEVAQGEWEDGHCSYPYSPLLFDRDGDGFHLTSPEDGVLFDIDGDGNLDQVAWPRADSGDAWLAMDRNGNGQIDDGSELFGNHTPAYPNKPLLSAADGFAALDLLQGPDYGVSYADSIVDERDAMFRQLLIWTDSNHNGISEPHELQSASAAGLVAISTKSVTRNRRDRHGNEFRLKGESWWRNDRGKARREVVWDVWLRVAQ